MRVDLIDARKRLGIKPRELAEKVGISLKDFVGFMRAGKDLPEDVVSKIKKELGIKE
jgi:predicted transcriptional regulator